MVKKDDFVQVHYTGTLDSGEIFDSSLQREPLEFQVGSGMVIPGFDNAVMGMSIDEEKDIIINPEEAYGSYDETAIYNFPKKDFNADFDPEIGLMVGLTREDGMQIPARIVDINDEDIVFDCNHPLAGKTLHFNIKLIEVNDSPKRGPGPDCQGCSGGNCSDGCGC